MHVSWHSCPGWRTLCRHCLWTRFAGNLPPCLFYTPGELPELLRAPPVSTPTAQEECWDHGCVAVRQLFSWVLGLECGTLGRFSWCSYLLRHPFRCFHFFLIFTLLLEIIYKHIKTCTIPLAFFQPTWGLLPPHIQILWHKTYPTVKTVFQICHLPPHY